MPSRSKAKKGGRTPGYKRILLKLSGEALAERTQRSRGVDSASLTFISKEVKRAYETGVQLAIVVGGGNIWRGAQDRGTAIERVTADYMGMLATIINALALQDSLESMGVPTRVQTAIEIPKLAEAYIRRRAIRHLEKKRVVIFAGGTGNPYFSTDTAASLRAVEIEADAVLKATKVDGVYTADPKTDKKAKLLKTATFMDAIRRRLGVMDATALTLCMENRMPVVVFNLAKKDNIKKAVTGVRVGTCLKE